MLSQPEKVLNIDKLLITNASIDDIDDIATIEILSFKIPWTKESFIHELTINELAMYIVAKINNKTVGYAGMWKVLEEGHITNIAVHPDLRGRKIGTGLVDVLINIAKDAKIEKLTLEVRQSNIPAQNLYSNFGFEIAGIRKRYYADNNEDALIMWKVI